MFNVEIAMKLHKDWADGEIGVYIKIELTFSIRRTFSEQIFLNEDNESLQKGIS
jgi:hypothetical protein